MKATIRFVIILLFAASPLRAQPMSSSSSDTTAATSGSSAAPSEFPRGKISGLTFGDLYWNAVGDPSHAYDPGSGADSGRVNIDASGRPITRDLNGLQFRRIYFQLDNDLSEKYSTRLRLELDGRSATNDGKISAFLKNAYLQTKGVWPHADLVVGMVNTLTFETAEEFWQYRSIEKTVGDFAGISSSSDLGVRVNGFLDTTRRVGYSAMIGDGTGQRPENNRDKRFSFALPLRFSKLIFEPYADYENVPGSRDRATYRVFIGVEAGDAAVGIEAYDRVAHSGGGNAELRAGSVFARCGSPTAKLRAFARADLIDPDVRVPDRVRQWLWIAGLDWQPLENVHVMPNFEGTHYQEQGTATAPPWHDLQARITFYYKFSRPQS